MTPDHHQRRPAPRPTSPRPAPPRTPRVPPTAPAPLSVVGHTPVDLRVPALRVQAPRTITAAQQSSLDRWSARVWEMGPQEWQEAQLTRLALASVLEARLLHVREERLATFNKTKDPRDVTLRELSALWRSHGGMAGQAFELAVADACLHGVPHVVEPLQQALALLGVHGGPPRMRVLGLEKVPDFAREQFIESVLSDVSPGIPFRNGLRGRPPTARTALSRFAGGQLQQPGVRMGAPSSERDIRLAQTSQLSRADAFVYTDTGVVAASMKVNPTAVSRSPGWRDVPLWITRSQRSPVTQVYARDDTNVPAVVVELANSTWTECFEEALEVLDVALFRLDMGRRTRPAGGVATVTWGWRWSLVTRLLNVADRPIAEICTELRTVHPGVRDMFSGELVATASATATIPTLDDGPLKQAWQDEGASGCLTVGQSHLFFSRPAA